MIGRTASLLGRPLVALGLILAVTGRLSAQETAPALKAAFLYNFAKFATWPAATLASGQRLSLCVVGDDGVADALERTIRGYSIEDHELVVTVMGPEEPATACHLLYVSASHLKRAESVLASLKEAPVLTVSDAENFAESAGIAQLIVQRNQIRFAINAEAASRARVRLSSKLLRLSHPVSGGTNGRR
jgi:hypothetical protein